MRIARSFLVGSVLLLAQPVHAEPAAPVAAAVADPARSAGNRALDEGRHPAEVLAFAGIRRGATVVDWMSGQGYYSELMADLVGPGGKVVAVEPAEFYKPEAWSALTAAHANVSLMSGPLGTQKLAPASADVIFSHLTFHDLFLGTMRGTTLPDPQAVLAMWRAALKPGGVVVIADHAGPAGDTGDVARKLHRIAVVTAKAQMAQAGFALVSESDLLHRSDDDLTKLVFDPAVRGKTDRFLLKFRVKSR